MRGKPGWLPISFRQGARHKTVNSTTFAQLIAAASTFLQPISSAQR
jgi:hypothetical protein